ncbi:MAG: beta-propeller fold lactonase family protein [Terriglobia bacterium]
MIKGRFIIIGSVVGALICGVAIRPSVAQSGEQPIHLSTSKLLQEPAPGQPRRTNSFPGTIAISPDGRYAAILNDGYGTKESHYDQSIAILNLATNELRDFPDARLGKRAHQTYFLGLAFSTNGKRLYASIASISDPEGARPGDLGDGIAVYKLKHGEISPQAFLKIGLQPLGTGQRADRVSYAQPKTGAAIPYPAGIAVARGEHGDRILVADNLSDDALLIDARKGEVIHRFDLSSKPNVPSAYPYGVVVARDGKTAYCSLWNASQVAQLNLESGQVTRLIPLLPPAAPTAAGSHPTAMLFSPDQKLLYVALANRDRVAVVDTAQGRMVGLLSTELPGEKFGGTYPNGLALSADGKRLFVADASQDAVAVFDVARGFGELPAHGLPAAPAAELPAAQAALGFIPTEWYPTAVAVEGNDLLMTTGKGRGTGPNSAFDPDVNPDGRRGPHAYIPTLIHGSIARIDVGTIDLHLAAWTKEVEESNRMEHEAQSIHFASGQNPIRHVIYIIKENRSYDQVFGDLKPGNGDPSLVMYGQDITPNQHELARQFGVLDNFYVSGEVSGNGHVWSNAAIDSDYTEKTWEISYRGSERRYDYEGQVSNAYPLLQGIADVDEPGTGYIWADVASYGLTHRNYGEFVATEWCFEAHRTQSPLAGTPEPVASGCSRSFVKQGEPLPPNVGQPHGSKSPWPWEIPMIARDVATMPELRGHFDPRSADFNLYYPDQLRVDEFLNEFDRFIKARQSAQGTELPQFVILRLPDDHTAGTRPGAPKPIASVADNDLAVGRVVEAVSHSPYWDDTAICILEDDAQDGPDHVDAHRSPALVISKYAPGSAAQPFVDSHFYTTVNMIRTMEWLLGLPPMNNNDAQADLMTPLFSGSGHQPPFKADYHNRDNGLIYQTNPPNAPGARQSAQMDFSHADKVNAHELNAILWRARKGDVPMPAPRHTVFPPDGY